MKIPSIIFKWAAQASILLLLAAVGGLTGCLSRPHLNKQTFTFSTPTETGEDVIKGGHVLGIRSLQIAAPFEGRSLVYRTGEFSYESDPHAEFLESPAEELMSPMRARLSQSGNFSAVVAGGSALKPDLLVEINVSQLWGDFRQPEHPAAVLAVQFVFLDATNGVPGKAIFQKEYSRRIPLIAPTAAGLMAGWNQALTEVLTQLSSDLRDANTGTQGNKFPSGINERLPLDRC